MGKENICFLTIWITLGNIFATFSSSAEPATTTVFGKPLHDISLNEVCLTESQM